MAENGHCYGEREQLVKKAKELLEVEEGEIEVTLDEMLRSKDVIQDEEGIYLPPYYFSESGCAKKLIHLLLAGQKITIDPEITMKKGNVPVRDHI